MPGSGPAPARHLLPPIWFWALAYALALAFIAPSPDIRHADDYHYLEASLQMAEGNDWLVPRQPDGEPRLRKPVFSYWPLALSFRAFGHSMGAARLPYILAGALTVWLIGLLGVKLAGRSTGRLAAMMTAACLPWLMAGLRTIPDVWLCLFTTLAAGGFLMRLSGEYGDGSLWLGWMGVGFAMATKGMAAFLVLPAVLAASFMVTRDAWKRLLHWPAILTAVLLGGGWYLAVAIELGPSSLLSFTSDQLKATMSAGEVARQAGAYLLIVPLGLLPWSLLAAGTRPADWRRAMENRHGRLLGVYAVAFTLVLIGVFSFAYQFSGGRYLLPAYPWIALSLALALREAIDAGRPGRWLRGLVVAMLSLFMLAVWLGVQGLGAALGLIDDGSLVRVLAISLALVALLFGTRVGPGRNLWVQALLVLAFLPLLFAQIEPGLPGSAGRIAEAVRERDLPQPVLMADEGSLAGVVRVLSGGRMDFTEKVDPPPARERFGTLIMARQHLPEDAYPDCERTVVAEDYRRVDSGDMIAAIRAGEGEAFLAEQRQPYLLITCPGEAGDAPGDGT